ncbi:flagellar biosynthesis protein FlgN [Duganella sp. Leaf126]|uniref:flagella synthesis protein FlgN n=1 Tax=Duganella sp. Leaf126 TaxID=1736266 RepID=UPI0006FDDA52|nr:flagellar protein FlgN [Duganella sp. Leaf126]KQQ33449.1 flagellar biosynthesis protein FlgN [Duganella sp. Leaf126]
MTTVTPLDNLREEAHIMTTLLDLLKQEQQMLVSAEIEALDGVTSKKTALISQMTLLSAQRHRALAKAGFPAEEAGMEAWIAASGDDQIADAWTALLDTTREAKELNRINGMLINKQISNTQGALAALRPATGGQTYSATGMSNPIPRSRGFLAG